MLVRLNWKKAVPGAYLAAYWIFALLYWEALLHWAVFDGFGAECLYAVGFSVSMGLLLALAASFLKKGRFAVSFGLTLALTVLYGSQLVYNFIFGTLYSAAMAAQGGEAMTTFWRELLSVMGEKCLWLIALFVPLAALMPLKKFLKEPVGLWGGVVLLTLALAAFGVTRYGIALGGGQMFTDEYYYTSGEIATNQTTQRFGLLTTLRLELTRKQRESERAAYYIPEETEPETVEEAPRVYGKNILDMDWDALNAGTTNQKLLDINDYLSLIHI